MCKQPHSVLGTLYDKIERCLERIPEDAAYRKYTAEIISHRHNILKSVINNFSPIVVKKYFFSGFKHLNLDFFFFFNLAQMLNDRN